MKLRDVFDSAKRRDLREGWLYLPANTTWELDTEGLFLDRIDPEIQTLVWPNGADFDAATLHDWPAVAEAWIARAKEWDAAAV
jgi:hypothetical protein